MFCPGCGHGIILKMLGFVVDEMKIGKEITLGIDIGCSLLAWDFFNFDTVQTHHGRTASVMVGYKMAKPKRIALAYMGDGGGYAIGLQSLIHSAYRNDPISVIVVNNANYGMTGGQMSPTTPLGTKTTTSPQGKEARFGAIFLGPELLRQTAHRNAFIARASVSNPLRLKVMIQKLLENQIKNNSFSFLEILSLCPINWKTNAKESLEVLRGLEEQYKIGEYEAVG